MPFVQLSWLINFSVVVVVVTVATTIVVFVAVVFVVRVVQSKKVNKMQIICLSCFLLSCVNAKHTQNQLESGCDMCVCVCVRVEVGVGVGVDVGFSLCVCFLVFESELFFSSSPSLFSSLSLFQAVVFFVFNCCHIQYHHPVSRSPFFLSASTDYKLLFNE